MDRVITATNNHHFNDERSLRIVINPNGSVKRFWNDIDASSMDLIEELHAMFCFTGIEPSRIQSDGGSVNDIYKLLYDIPFPGDVRFMHISTCGCNMGHCSGFKGAKVEPPVDTFGEAMALLGIEEEMDGITFYQYPDSVLLSMDWWTKEIERKYLSSRCPYDSPREPEPLHLDPTVRYIFYSYGR